MRNSETNRSIKGRQVDGIHNHNLQEEATNEHKNAENKSRIENPAIHAKIETVLSYIPVEAIAISVLKTLDEDESVFSPKIYAYPITSMPQGVMNYDVHAHAIVINTVGFDNSFKKFTKGVSLKDVTEVPMEFVAYIMQGMSHELTHALGAAYLETVDVSSDKWLRSKHVCRIGYSSSFYFSEMYMGFDNVTQQNERSPDRVEDGILFNEGVTELLSWESVLRMNNSPKIRELLKERFVRFATKYKGTYAESARLIWGMLMKKSQSEEDFEVVLKRLRVGYRNDGLMADNISSTTLAELFGPWGADILKQMHGASDIQKIAKKFSIDLDESSQHLLKHHLKYLST